MLDISVKPGIYVHIPFCVSKCKYCAFLSAPSADDVKGAYVNSLLKEIRLRAESCDLGEVDTVYFGGGTPTTLAPAELKRILDEIKACFDIATDAEITIEANPGTISSEVLVALREIGFNRLSMGVQSMNDMRLKFMGRIHTSDDVRRDYEAAREAGFNNINLDIMFSIPGETTADALNDIEQIAGLGPEHISFYSLQLEEGTPFYEMWEKMEIEEVPDEIDRMTYHEGIELLKSLGYEQYEISNFARKGYESRHNSKYWNMADYLGLGLGASGMITMQDTGDRMRYSNLTDLASYMEATRRMVEPEADNHINSEHDNISEAIFTGLRRVEGIKYADLFDGGEEAFWDYYAEESLEIREYAERGCIVIDKDGLRLTSSGFDISNTIMAIFV